MRDEDTTCARCGETISVDWESEWVQGESICHGCEGEVIFELRAEVATLKAQNAQIVKLGDDLAGQIVELRAANDRLQALLDAETGKRGREGWVIWPDGTWQRRLEKGFSQAERISLEEGCKWKTYDASGQRGGRAVYILEAMEAADGSVVSKTERGEK